MEDPCCHQAHVTSTLLRSSNYASYSTLHISGCQNSAFSTSLQLPRPPPQLWFPCRPLCSPAAFMLQRKASLPSWCYFTPVKKNWRFFWKQEGCDLTFFPPEGGMWAFPSQILISSEVSSRGNRVTTFLYCCAGKEKDNHALQWILCGDAVKR